MGLQDVAFLPSRTFLHCGRGEIHGTTTCLETVVRGRQVMLPAKYFCSNKTSSLCQLNFMKIIRLS